MEPFKNLLHSSGIATAARRIHAAWPKFDRRGLVRQAAEGLDALEMKAPAPQICAALEATLPADFGAAADAVLHGTPRGDDSLAGWTLWQVAASAAFTLKPS